MKVIVTNITNFGAFVDIGVHQDGLVHTSQLANRFVANPNEVVKVSQVVEVTVTDIDVDRKRISLSMKEEGSQEARKSGSPKVFDRNKEQGARNKDEAQKTTQLPRKQFNQHPPKKEKEVDGDLQEKLAKLKGMFK